MKEKLVDLYNSDITVFKDQSTLTINKLFKNYLLDLLGYDYHRFINHRVSKELTFRKEYWLKVFHKNLALIDQIEFSITNRITNIPESLSLLFQLIANFVKDIDNRILRYEVITKIYFLEITGLKTTSSKFKSIDKKIQFTDQEKQLLKQQLIEEINLLKSFKVHFFQTTNLLMLRTHNVLSNSHNFNGMDLKIDVSWAKSLTNQQPLSNNFLNNLKLFCSFCILIKDEIMIETNEPSDYAQYEQETIKWLNFLIKMSLTEDDHQSLLIYKNFWYHESDHKQIVIKVNVSLMESLINDFKYTCMKL